MDDNHLVENLWVRVKGEARKGGAVVELCYRLPQDEEVDETLFK